MEGPQLLDLDGVFCNFNAGLFRALAGPSPSEPDWTTWPTTWDWPQAAGYDAQHRTETWARVTQDPWWWAALPPYPEVEAVWAALGENDRGPHRLLVSARPAQVALGTAAWVSLHLCPTLERITGVYDKGLVAEAVGASLAVDDRPEECDAYVDAGVPRVYLIDRPYNRQYRRAGVTRIALTDLPEVCR